MRIITFLLFAATLPLGAQVEIHRVPGRGFSSAFNSAFSSAYGAGLEDASRVAIGVTTKSSTRGRDTLGVLVTAVRTGSPADKAGIGEGDRIAAINGVSLRLAAADIDAPEMAGIMSRRLTRELDKLKAGDEVELRLYTNGQGKTVRVKTVAADDLYASPMRRRDDERATLGINIGMTGSSRDTLGVFVMSVVDDGPAAKAGIEEGSRIASVNGVDVRGRQDADADDYILRTSNVNRLEREIGKVKPGDEVDLRVYYNRQYKNVKVRSVPLSDLPRRNRTIMMMGGGNLASLPMLRERLPVDIGRTISSELGRAFTRVGMGNRVVW